MLKRKTIAINVTNLSDARYFAAYEVDNIAYVISPDGSNLGEIKEIITWVEGPTPLIQMQEYDEALTRFALETTGAKGVVLPYESLKDVDQNPENVWSLNHPIPALPAQNNTIPIIAVGKAGLNEKPHLEEAFLMPTDIEMTDFEKVIEAHPQTGVVLSGSEEERVGLKSFEAQDELIDLLLDED